MQKNIYLDHSATTYVKKEVLEEMIPYFTEKYGNPSSVYSLASLSKEAIEKAREKVASYINSSPEEIYFTSGGTEADNLAIFGIVHANKEKGNHVITSKIEHPAVLETFKKLEKEGFKVTYLNVNKDGKILIEELKNSINKNTVLVSIMAVNNEIGTIQDLQEIGNICKENNVYFHTDAVAAIGSIDIDVEKYNIDLLSMSGHKFYGPKGVGALYVRDKINFNSHILGGHQEKCKRAGTENVPAIVGMGKAIEIAKLNLKENTEKIFALKKYFLNKILSEIRYVKINGNILNQSASNINVEFKNVDSNSLLLLLASSSICASAGSACSSKDESISHVIKAIGGNKQSIRFTLGIGNTYEEINYVVLKLKEYVNKLRNFN